MPEFNDRRPTIPAEERVTKGYAALWHGGNGYGEPYHENHLEHFPSKAAAKAEMKNRARGWADINSLDTDHTGAVAHRDSHTTQTPGVDENSRMDLHPIRKDGTYDRDVFHRLTPGRRGGVR